MKAISRQKHEGGSQMSKLRFFSIYLMVLAVSSGSLSLATSAQQAKGTATDPLVTQTTPVATSIQFKDAEYYLRTYGKKAKPLEGTLVFEPGAKAVRFVAKGKTELDVPNNIITRMLYEPTSTRRYALAVLVSKYFLLTKSTKHFLTIQYKKPNGEADAALIRLDKENYEMALATAEAQTGVRIERMPAR
jgi:hypothetical protein